MAAQLILQFEGVSEADYWAVNQKLGISHDQAAGWPEGIQTHTAGFADSGAFVVTEVWDSQEAQGRFMESRLGPALHEVGLPAPASITWIELFGQKLV